MRGLWRLKGLFAVQSDDYCIKMQAMFYDFFCALWMTSDAQGYFQGVTDVFEVFFAAFMDPEALNMILDMDAKGFNFELLFGENNQVIFGYAVQLLNQIAKRMGKTIDRFGMISSLVFTYVQQLDPILANLLSEIELEQFKTFMLKATISAGLHLVNGPKISAQLGLLFIEASDDEQALVLQTLLSIGARTYSPQSFPPLETEQLYANSKKLQVPATQPVRRDKFECGLELMQNALSSILGQIENEESLVEIIQFTRDNYKRLRRRRVE